jgi:cytoskeletal protein CcmA (bactofilin family)
MQREIKKSDLIGPYVIATVGLVSAVTGIVLALTYNESPADLNLKKITIGETEENSFTLPTSRAPDAGQFLVADDDGKTTWAYALSSNKNLDVNVGVISVKGIQIENNAQNQIRSIVVPEGTYTLPTILPIAGDMLIAGFTNPAETTWGKSILIKFDASIAPNNTNDKSQRYTVGSQWFDTVNANAYVCLNADTNVAVWKIITFEIINQFDATTGPFIGNDNTQGYSIGSQWIDTTANRAYLCVDSSKDAAIWIIITDDGSLDIIKIKTQNISSKSLETTNVSGELTATTLTISETVEVNGNVSAASANIAGILSSSDFQTGSLTCLGAVNISGVVSCADFITTAKTAFTEQNQIVTKKYVDDHVTDKVLSQKGKAFGFTELNSIGKVPKDQLSLSIKDNLNDVIISADLAEMEILQFIDNAWQNKTLAESGISATVHTHVMSDITGLNTVIDSLEEKTQNIFASNNDQTTIQGAVIAGSLIVSNSANVTGNMTVTGPLNCSDAVNIAGVVSCSDFLTTTQTLFTEQNQIVTKKYVDDHVTDKVLSQKGKAFGFTELNAIGKVPKDQLSLSIKDNLNDVIISADLAEMEILQFIDNAWQNKTLAESGISATSHTHVMSDITGLNTVIDSLEDKTQNITRSNTNTIISGILQATQIVASNAVANYANFNEVAATNLLSINGSSLEILNNTLTATINSIPYPIVGRSLSSSFSLVLNNSQTPTLHNISGDLAIRWSLQQVQFIDNSDTSNSYSFTMSVYNTRGVFRSIGTSTFAGWRFLTPNGQKDNTFDADGSSGRIDFTLISENDLTKPSYIGSVIHGSSTAACTIEVIYP